MSYIIKCPFCAEEINSDAIICKHCQKKLNTFDVKQNIKMQINKIELVKLQEELRDKIDLYPKKIRGFIINNKKVLEKIRTLNNEEILKDVFIRERKYNINILLLVSLFLLFVFPLALIFSIWLYPKKDEKEIFKNRIRDFREFKGRIILSIITLFIGFSIISSDMEESNKKAEEIRIKNEEITKQELINNTLVTINYGTDINYTNKENLDLKITLKNINKLIINDKEISFSGNTLDYKVPLLLGDNKISVIGYNGDIIKEVNKNIKRVSNNEFNKLEAERIKRVEEQKKKQEELDKKEKDRIQKEEMDKKVQSQFSGWNGSHIVLSDYVKKNLKDPDSYEHIETKYSLIRQLDDSYYVVVYMKYRAKNGFGGYTIENIKAFFDIDGNPVNLENWVQN